jgi:DNA repair protein RadC
MDDPEMELPEPKAPRNRKFKCSGDRIPVVQLALAKKVCLRTLGQRLTSGDSVARFVLEHYGCAPQEHFLALFLSNRSEVLALHEVSLGGLAATMVDPRVVFSGALLAGAAAMIMIHNHPSGDPEPSELDIALTKQIVGGARLLGINVLDHVIIGRGGKWLSMLQSGRADLFK